MYQVEILALAQKDIQSVADYYKQISIKLRDRFLTDLKFCLKNIQSNPKSFQVKYKEIRVCFIKGFPYGIFYKIYGNEIKIIAIIHTSRSPDKWKNR